MKKIVRKKGNKGAAQKVTCDGCGARIMRDKAIRVRKHSLPMGKDLIDILNKMGARVHVGQVIVSFCISCAKHRRII